MRPTYIPMQRGFSLIDLLIGIVIGVIALLAATRIMTSFTQQRNTISQQVEAQSNGTMALYLLERDIGQAGYGLMPLQNCPQINWYLNGSVNGTNCSGTCGTTPTAGCCGVQSPLGVLPVAIVDGGAASDTISVQYAKTPSGAPATTISVAQGSFTAPYNVATTVGYSVNDLVVANVNGSCTMSRATDVDTPTNPLQVLHATPDPYNPATAPPSGATVGWEVAPVNTVLVNLGDFNSHVYRVSGSSLWQNAFPFYGGVQLVDGIVFMKAQYGLDTDSNGSVDTWQGGSAVIGNARQVLAIRVGIVAQSPLYEKDGIDAPTTINVLPAPSNGLAGPAVNYTIPNLDANGKAHYRYRTYYTIIPLRNVIWAL